MRRRFRREDIMSDYARPRCGHYAIALHELRGSLPIPTVRQHTAARRLRLRQRELSNPSRGDRPRGPLISTWSTSRVIPGESFPRCEQENYPPPAPPDSGGATARSCRTAITVVDWLMHPACWWRKRARGSLRDSGRLPQGRLAGRGADVHSQPRDDAGTATAASWFEKGVRRCRARSGFPLWRRLNGLAMHRRHAGICWRSIVRDAW